MRRSRAAQRQRRAKCKPTHAGRGCRIFARRAARTHDVGRQRAADAGRHEQRRGHEEGRAAAERVAGGAPQQRAAAAGEHGHRQRRGDEREAGAEAVHDADQGRQEEDVCFYRVRYCGGGCKQGRCWFDEAAASRGWWVLSSCVQRRSGGAAHARGSAAAAGAAAVARAPRSRRAHTLARTNKGHQEVCAADKQRVRPLALKRIIEAARPAAAGCGRAVGAVAAAAAAAAAVHDAVDGHGCGSILSTRTRCLGAGLYCSSRHRAWDALCAGRVGAAAARPGPRCRSCAGPRSLSVQPEGQSPALPGTSCRAIRSAPATGRVSPVCGPATFHKQWIMKRFRQGRRITANGARMGELAGLTPPLGLCYCTQHRKAHPGSGAAARPRQPLATALIYYKCHEDMQQACAQGPSSSLL